MSPTHPSFSKKIDWKHLIYMHAQRSCNHEDSLSDRNIVLPILYGQGQESDYKQLLYADCIKRFNNISTPSTIFFSLRDYSTINTVYDMDMYAHLYRQTSAAIRTDIEQLGIQAQVVDVFDGTVLDTLDRTSTDLMAAHRIGDRNDIAHYDVSSGAMIPSLYTVSSVQSSVVYTIKFFLNGNKDTLLADISHPYLLFGCVGIVIHPQDKRYKRMRDTHMILPITNRQVPVIVDESITIEGHGTRLLIPGHDSDDYTFCIQHNIDCEIVAYDQNGRFPDHAKEFALKSLTQFGDNVIKYIDDIGNLEYKTPTQETITVHRMTNARLYPLLQRHIYMNMSGLGTFTDYNLVAHDGHKDVYRSAFEQDDSWRLTNTESHNMLARGWNETMTHPYGSSLMDDIIYDCYILGLYTGPVSIDQLVSAMTMMIHERPIRQLFAERRMARDTYTDQEQVMTILEAYTTHPTVEIFEQFVSMIDRVNCLVHTKQGYIVSGGSDALYRYDNEYIGLVTMLSRLQLNGHVMLLGHRRYYGTIKRFCNLASYTKKNFSSAEIVICDDVETVDKANRQLLEPSVQRLYLLQSLRMTEHDESESTYTVDQLHRFVHKRRNICRIFPVFLGLDLSALQQEIGALGDEISDLEKALLSRLYDAYREIKYLRSKHQIAQEIKLLIETLQYVIVDVMLLLYKTDHHGPSTDMICAYIILFANHMLYPYDPLLAGGILSMLGLQHDIGFYQRDYTLFVEPHYQSNLYIELITTWYRLIQQKDVSTFVLQANTSFLEYAQSHAHLCVSLLGEDVTIDYLDEQASWPDDIERHQIFALGRGYRIISHDSVVQTTSVPSTPAPSLSILEGQLSYKKQLLQTLKNTLIRARTTNATTTIADTQSKITLLNDEIMHLEYEISKLKYF